jgi:N-carbamoyl-L-amino-acid hydrolase
VATVGRIRCTPNAANVIPGAVELSLDVRDVEQSAIESAARCILDAIAAIAKRRHIGFESERTGRSPPQPMAPAIVERLTALADRAGIRHHHMASGALHDALVMARVTPTGMIFVPSRDGRSHSPTEWTDYKDIAVGAELLLAAVTDLAAC